MNDKENVEKKRIWPLGVPFRMFNPLLPKLKSRRIALILEWSMIAILLVMFAISCLLLIISALLALSGFDSVGIIPPILLGGIAAWVCLGLFSGMLKELRWNLGRWSPNE